MFTGLIQTTGAVIRRQARGQGYELTVDVSGLAETPQLGASIAVSGACLTVTRLAGTAASFDVAAETAARTTLGRLNPGDPVNLEPALRAGAPLDGHLVQGHVDTVGAVLGVEERGGSWLYRFSLPEALTRLVAVKGSVAVDGISLTVVEAQADWFTVSVIPHTRRETTLAGKHPGDAVNLEADVLARYVARWLGGADTGGGLSEDFLRRHGFA